MIHPLSRRVELAHAVMHAWLEVELKDAEADYLIRAIYAITPTKNMAHRLQQFEQKHPATELKEEG